jgi:hypothetical protein
MKHDKCITMDSILLEGGSLHVLVTANDKRDLYESSK